ncbi:MAG TPA: 50S ribosomal protein L3 N(5)-glutamine methyltransferase [Methylomirabilota bacterium]|nr:50S ribosomal protein L3 N(5)-glutamine methyltransferase [Methylomirabilota bacterium]
MNRPAEDLLTVRDLLRYAVTRFNSSDLVFGHGATTALDDAVFLILEALKLPIDEVDPWLDARLTLFERERVVALIEQRISTRKPTPYLLNRAYIQGLAFYVDERVIVPRSFIAEILAETTDEEGSELFGALEDVVTIADICTGSGCLAILASRLFPYATVDAVDLSEDALAVAAINVANLADGRVSLYHGDLVEPLGDSRYDLIISNPPYVDEETMRRLPPEFQAEPDLALSGGFDGLDLVRRLLADVPDRLTDSGSFICEIGSGRKILEAEYPDLPFVWLDTADSEGEVFLLTSEAFELSEST